MFDTLFDSDKRHYAKCQKLCKKVLALEDEFSKKSDEDLLATTYALQKRLENGKTLEDILPEAFANAREASKRVLHQFPYPVQVLGGILIHYGDIAEMKTGEGKTLTAVMPIYLNALEKKGAHVVTVNEYLAQRDTQWMGEIYRFLGLSVGCNLHELSKDAKREAYACDITYTTNSELGFDYLKDNMVLQVEDRVLRGLHYAVLDECDSILIDEARTPLIISGTGPKIDGSYIQANEFVQTLKKEDVEIDEEQDSASLSESGIHKAEKFYGVSNFYTKENNPLVHYTNNALKANFRMHKGVEYIVENDEIMLVDAFTGRKMEGREYSNGLHQALQVKEGLGIKQESRTLATITYQNFFRLYDKLSGMTGTAKSSEEELLNTYNMRVFVIPTNKPVQRVDEKDAVFATKHEKFEAIVDETKRLYEKGQPVLVGTPTVNDSCIISEMLTKMRIPHRVLNCINDYEEAEIISKAGGVHKVTVATNMAGRGTDIKLDSEALELGGLVVLGSERLESKRIDNQLKGRSGRQGDPGNSRFYVSFEDDLIKEYAGDEAKVEMEKFLAGKIGLDRIRKVVDDVQLRAEGLHFDSRKKTLEYDNTMMQQRNVYYGMRDQVLESEDIRPLLKELIDVCMQDIFEEVQDPALQLRFLMKYGLDEETASSFLKDPKGKKKASEWIWNFGKTETEGEDFAYWRVTEKVTFLRCGDYEWRNHVEFMEDLKHGIGLRGYAQKKPADEYREEGVKHFNYMQQRIARKTILRLLSYIHQGMEE